MNNIEFMKKSERRVEELWTKLETHYKRTLPRPSVEFNLRSRTCAGMCTDGGRTLRFNLAYSSKNGEEMLGQTVPHEVAHAWLTQIGDPSHVASGYSFSVHPWGGTRARRTKRSPHGTTFMNLLMFLGGTPSRTHNMELDTKALGRRGVTWKYKCKRCGRIFELSTRKHNAIRRGGFRFHTPCGPETGRLERVI